MTVNELSEKKKKKDLYGSIEKYKGRLVAKGVYIKKILISLIHKLQSQELHPLEYY